jgi:hypothetical protein
MTALVSFVRRLFGAVHEPHTAADEDIADALRRLSMLEARVNEYDERHST